MGTAILRHRTNLRHWRINIQTSYVCPVVFDVSNTSQFAYVTFTIICDTSAKLCLFQQHTWVCVSRWYRPDFKIACFCYTYSVINCLLWSMCTITMHNQNSIPLIGLACLSDPGLTSASDLGLTSSRKQQYLSALQVTQEPTHHMSCPEIFLSLGAPAWP